MLIDLVVYDGLDEMDVVGPLEVFRSAATAGAEVTARLVTRAPQPIVTGAFGLRFEPDAVYHPGSDILLVPGGGWLARSGQGAWGEYRRGGWLSLLREAHDAGVGILAGVCTGTMLLAHAGVIGARPATTHHGAWLELEATCATLVQERVVEDGDLVTCGGVTSGIDLALWLLEREVSFALASSSPNGWSTRAPSPRRQHDGRSTSTGTRDRGRTSPPLGSGCVGPGYRMNDRRTSEGDAGYG